LIQYAKMIFFIIFQYHDIEMIIEDSHISHDIQYIEVRQQIRLLNGGNQEVQNLKMCLVLLKYE
jgi:hypothetical protein